jgi:hypothetical protein
MARCVLVRVGCVVTLASLWLTPACHAQEKPRKEVGGTDPAAAAEAKRKQETAQRKQELEQEVLRFVSLLEVRPPNFKDAKKAAVRRQAAIAIAERKEGATWRAILQCRICRAAEKDPDVLREIQNTLEVLEKQELDVQELLDLIQYHQRFPNYPDEIRSAACLALAERYPSHPATRTVLQRALMASTLQDAAAEALTQIDRRKKLESDKRQK